MSSPKSEPLDLGDILLSMHGSVMGQMMASMIRTPFWADWYILEAGSGTGKFGIWFALRYSANVVLMDIDEVQLARSYKLLRIVELMTETRLPVALRDGNILNTPYNDNTFDFVYNEGVVEHWHKDDPRRLKCIKEMVRVSKKYVGIITNDADGPKTRFRAETTIQHYPTMPEKEEPYTEQELRENMEKAGLKNVQVRKLDHESTQEYLIATGEKI